LVCAVGLFSWTLAPATTFVFAAAFTRATGLTATVFVPGALAITWATAGFGPALPAFTKAVGCEAPFTTGTVVGLTKTPTVGALFAGTALLAVDACGITFCFGSRLADFGTGAFTETAFCAGVVDALFAPAEIVFFRPATTGLTEPAF
jgi:hypothetical protein